MTICAALLTLPPPVFLSMTLCSLYYIYAGIRRIGSDNSLLRFPSAETSSVPVKNFNLMQTLERTMNNAKLAAENARSLAMTVAFPAQVGCSRRCLKQLLHKHIFRFFQVVSTSICSLVFAPSFADAW